MCPPRPGNAVAAIRDFHRFGHFSIHGMEKDFTQTTNPGVSPDVAGLHDNDLDQILEHGIPVPEVIRQLGVFSSGIPKTMLDRPATVNDGILRFSDAEFEKAAQFFDVHKSGLKLKKFVPASGAASRMFKFLLVFLNEFDIAKDTINSYVNRHKASDLSLFISAKEKFSF
ncbi:MAG: DUF4301 family protein, partial [Chitinophagaceae bacterium]